MPPPQCAGDLLLSPKTKERAASPALFRDIIKSLWDKEADEYGEGRRVTTILNLTVGASYRWAPGIDFQSLGTKPKTVYPVKVKYTTCADYKIDWRITETKNEEVYSCYVEDGFGAWTCAIRKAADLKNTSVDKPAKKKITGEL